MNTHGASALALAACLVADNRACQRAARRRSRDRQRWSGEPALRSAGLSLGRGITLGAGRSAQHQRQPRARHVHRPRCTGRRVIVGGVRAALRPSVRGVILSYRGHLLLRLRIAERPGESWHSRLMEPGNPTRSPAPPRRALHRPRQPPPPFPRALSRRGSRRPRHRRPASPLRHRALPWRRLRRLSRRRHL